jgi:hypothetical protein
VNSCREVIERAERWLLGIVPGDQLQVDEITDGLAVLQDLVLEFPGLDVGGPWTDVDVTADYTVGEDERVRVQDGYEVDITYPNTVPAYTGAKEYFDADSWTGDYRPPRDGSRAMIVAEGITELRIYCADAGAWRTATDLTKDSAVPLPASCHNGLAAMLAERLALGKARADGRAVSPAPAVIEMAARGRNQIRALLTRRPIVTPADLPVLSRSVQAFW